MIKIDILSKRKYASWPSWHIVYEWEDDFSNVLKVPIHNSFILERLLDNKYSRELFSNPSVKKFFQYLNRRFDSSLKSIVFELSYKSNFSFSNGLNSVPIIIDFYSRDVDLFVETYKNSKLICITSLEVLNFLKQNNCPLNIKHLPLSLSDQYRNIVITKDRKYDVVFAGRKNPILWSYLLEFEKKHPEIEYLYQEEINNKLFYKSNKTGIVGDFHTREEYINLLGKCKVAFYSTPGIDGGEQKTNGFNQVTPRYLELFASGCLLMGRYPMNEETSFYELEKNCPNIESYTQFEATLLEYLNKSSIDVKKCNDFMEKHYTSNRAQMLKTYLQETFSI